MPDAGVSHCHSNQKVNQMELLDYVASKPILTASEPNPKLHKRKSEKSTSKSPIKNRCILLNESLDRLKDLIMTKVSLVNGMVTSKT